MYKWLFFDVGSTIVDETIAYEHRVRDTVANSSVTVEAFMKKRIEFASNNIFGDNETLNYFGLSKAPWHFEDEMLYPDAFDTIKYLFDKGYHLGIIANQSLGTEERLNKWGLMEYISIVSSSAEMGIEKPSKDIFLKSLELADCLPENAAMIGDRLDNDIFTAKTLGMRTVWVRQGFSALFDVERVSIIPDYTINTLSELLNIF